jgi:hypothetical protein
MHTASLLSTAHTPIASNLSHKTKPAAPYDVAVFYRAFSTTGFLCFVSGHVFPWAISFSLSFHFLLIFFTGLEKPSAQKLSLVQQL